MGAILKPSDQQGCHIWYYRVARSSVDTQTSPPAVIPRVTERHSACIIYLYLEAAVATVFEIATFPLAKVLRSRSIENGFFSF